MSFTVSNNGHTLHYKGSDIVLNSGDITKFHGDFIVNAAKPKLTGGGGVDGAIHRAAGPGLKNECVNKLRVLGKNKIGVAEVVSTGSYSINTVRAVIHTVGPNVKKYYRHNFNGAKQDLFNTYTNCIREANANRYSRGAFPGISVGAYKFPKKDGARISLKAICNQIDKGTSVKHFHLYANGKNYRHYEKLFDKAVKKGKIG